MLFKAVCVLLGFLQKTWAIPIMNPLSWLMTNSFEYAASQKVDFLTVCGSIFKHFLFPFLLPNELNLLYNRILEISTSERYINLIL